MRGQYREQLQVCEHGRDQRLRTIKPCETPQAGIRTSGADCQHDRNAISKKEEVEVEGSRLRMNVGCEIVVSQPNLTYHGKEQTARQQQPQRPGLLSVLVSTKQAR